MNDYFVVDLFCWWLKSSHGKLVVWGPVVSRILGVFLSSNPFHKSINPKHRFTISWSKGSNSLRTFALGWSNHILQTWWFMHLGQTNRSESLMTLSIIILLEKSWDVLKEDLIMTGGIRLPILGVSNNAHVWWVFVGFSRKTVHCLGW